MPQVSDVADVVRQRADALMLSGESAMGRYPQKALGVLRSVSASVEEWVRQEKYGVVALPSVSGLLTCLCSQTCEPAGGHAPRTPLAATALLQKPAPDHITSQHRQPPLTQTPLNTHHADLKGQR